MKKIFYFAICTFVLALNTSCEEDQVVFNNTSGTTAINFQESGSALKLIPSDPDTYSTLIQVNVTTVSDVDRVFTLAADYPPPAVDISNYFSIDASTLVIPAGSYNGYVKVTGNYDNISTGPAKLVRFTLTSIEGGVVSSSYFKYELYISKI